VILLVALLAFSGNSYAASRDSQATLHISVTLVMTVATGPVDPVEPAQVVSSENQSIIYNLRPVIEQNVAGAVMNTSQPKAQKPSPENVNDSSRDEPIVEVTTVVMK
jgi:hypothetical protein